MQITFASYNIRKAIGLDRRRDPERILAVLHEINADVVALQEADRRFGRRVSALPRDLIDDLSDYRPVPLSMRPDSIGWHGNAFLIKRDLELIEASVVPLPVLEPRGAIRADIAVNGQRIRVVGLHLDLSGLRRRHQVRAILAHVAGCERRCPTVLMGDFNEWARRGGCFREFDADWRVIAPGSSFPTRRPVAPLDRIVLSPEWKVLETTVHHSALSAKGSDHLPVRARLTLPNI